jgi:hypothetical protein
LASDSEVRLKISPSLGRTRKYCQNSEIQRRHPKRGLGVAGNHIGCCCCWQKAGHWKTVASNRSMKRAPRQTFQLKFALKGPPRRVYACTMLAATSDAVQSSQSHRYLLLLPRVLIEYSRSREECVMRSKGPALVCAILGLALAIVIFASPPEALKQATAFFGF